MHTETQFRHAFVVPLHSGGNNLLQTDFINTIILLSMPRALNIVCVCSVPPDLLHISEIRTIAQWAEIEIEHDKTLSDCDCVC
jgi:hypothetical protein